MACKYSSQDLLETEFSFLKQKFPKSHNLFVLSSHSEEETCMLFLLPDTTRIRFQVIPIHHLNYVLLLHWDLVSPIRVDKYSEIQLVRTQILYNFKLTLISEVPYGTNIITKLSL